MKSKLGARAKLRAFFLENEVKLTLVGN